MRFMNSRSWEVMRSAPWRLLRNASSQMIDSRSRWLVGSSIRRTSGSPRSTRAIAVDPLIVEAQPVQDLPRTSFERVAAEMVVLFLHVAESREDPVHLVRPGRIRHRMLQALELVMELTEATAAGNRFVEHRTAG